MRTELRSHKLMLSLIVGWISAFGGVLLALGAHHSDLKIEAAFILVLTVIAGAALAYVGLGATVVAGTFGPGHRREFSTYLTLGALAVALAIALSFATDESLALIALVVAPFPILLALAELRLARGLSHHRRLARALRICGSLELLCGVLLAGGFLFSELQVLELIATTAMVSLLQLLPFLAYRPHAFQRSERSPATGLPSASPAEKEHDCQDGLLRRS